MSTRYEVCKRIVENHTAEKVEGILVDAFTASALVAIYEALSPENQERFDTPPLPRLAELAWKSVS